MQRNFVPVVAPVTRAVWQFCGRLHPLTKPTAGIHWGAYIGAGGPFKNSRRAKP